MIAWLLACVSCRSVLPAVGCTAKNTVITLMFLSAREKVLPQMSSHACPHAGPTEANSHNRRIKEAIFSHKSRTGWLKVIIGFSHTILKSLGTCKRITGRSWCNTSTTLITHARAWCQSLPVLWWFQRQKSFTFYYQRLHDHSEEDTFPEVIRAYGNSGRHLRWRNVLEELHPGVRGLVGSEAHYANKVMLSIKYKLAYVVVRKNANRAIQRFMAEHLDANVIWCKLQRCESSSGRCTTLWFRKRGTDHPALDSGKFRTCLATHMPCTVNRRRATLCTFRRTIVRLSSLVSSIYNSHGINIQYRNVQGGDTTTAASCLLSRLHRSNTEALRRDTPLNPPLPAP